MKRNVIIQYIKEILQVLFWIVILLSIFIPNSLAFWLAEGFTK